MLSVHRLFFSFFILSFSASISGCGGESARVVEETEELTFDDMAAQAAAETALSEQEESP